MFHLYILDVVNWNTVINKFNDLKKLRVKNYNLRFINVKKERYFNIISASSSYKSIK